MLRFSPIYLSVFLTLSAADDWKARRAAEWSPADTKEILTNSPWGVMVVPSVKKTEPKGQGGGLDVRGVPGLGRHRPGQQRQETTETTASTETSQPFNVRWESALPIREAELKARETNAPAVDEDRYGIAVYGIPSHLAKDPQGLADRLKGQATLKREGQKDLKPMHVDVIPRDDGVVVVFLFAKTKEITAQDSRVEFSALIGPFQITHEFHVDEMIYQGKTEL
jgi:hypothetical protein